MTPIVDCELGPSSHTRLIKTCTYVAIYTVPLKVGSTVEEERVEDDDSCCHEWVRF